VLITGGAGFIGTNLAARLLRSGERVLIYDNLSRPGVDRNLQWLQTEFGSRLEIEISDIRAAGPLRRAVQRASRIYHFAAQVAVTTSLLDPTEDFDVNAWGTLNLLEAVRSLAAPPPVLMTSTNKVYGNLEDVELTRTAAGYLPADSVLREFGAAEDRNLDFHSPYGCSKGVADQYVRDYARCYGLPTVVFRMSCIYGPHQWGTEDQGWVAHFLLQAMRREPIRLYGDGCQVRDLLFVDDLVSALRSALDRIDATRGQVFNIGGGPANCCSLRGVLDQIAELQGEPPVVQSGPWRTGDQRYYVSDTRKFQQTTGWAPRVGVPEGLKCLHDWLSQNRQSAPVSSILEPKA
jgi:CDP-paratose 2-epimerase